MVEAANKSKSTLTFDKIYKKMIKDMPGKTVSRKDPAHLSGAEAIQITPYAGAKSLVFRCKVHSKDRKRRYNVVIQFLDVNFAAKPQGSGWSKVEYKDKTFYFEKPSFFKNPVRIRCGCQDFKQRFAWANKAVSCLAGGAPAKYRRKTPPPPKGRPYVNPDGIPGMCYHIFQVAKGLEKWTTLMR